MKIGFIPIDDRPVSFLLPEQIAAIDESIELILPERKWLGNLTQGADVNRLLKWLRNLDNLDAIVVSLDTIAYGGLIPSRRCSDSFEQIISRINELKNILVSKKLPVYAFSSIMRISNNNINEEEKEYWSQWGKKIFNYSYCMHKYGTVCKKEVPDNILEDYLSGRKRNFDVNKVYLNWQKEGIFSQLVFSKDDCSEYGFNVMEANELKNLGGFVKTGADEIPLSLLAMSLQKKVRIAPIFLEPSQINLISNYEDVSIKQCVNNQILLAGCEISDEQGADILLYVNNFKDHQGEIVMGIQTEMFNSVFDAPKRPYMIADVRFANGADNNFVSKLFECKFDENFFGYSAWNTSANSLGSLICTAKVKFLADKYNESAFKKSQIVRFLDDWAYQANVRQLKPSLSQIKDYMIDFEQIVFNKIGIKCYCKYKFPWNRLFEVEVELI